MLDTDNTRKTSVITLQCRTGCKNAHVPNWDEKKKKSQRFMQKEILKNQVKQSYVNNF